MECLVSTVCTLISNNHITNVHLPYTNFVSQSIFSMLKMHTTDLALCERWLQLRRTWVTLQASKVDTLTISAWIYLWWLLCFCGHCHGNSTFTKIWEGVREQYRIVLGKHPWPLAAQAPKIEDEWLHRRSVWTPQVSPRKCPPRPEYEVSCQWYQLDLHCCFACALSRPANSGESCNALESRLTHSLVAKLSQRSLLAFVLQSRNASYLWTRLLWMGVCKTLAAGCRGTWRSIAIKKR